MEIQAKLNSFRKQLLLHQPLSHKDWNSLQNIMADNGIGIEEMLKYLYHFQPSESEFENWVFSHKENIEALENNVQEDVLSESDLNFWAENGYVVVKNAIPQSDCLQTQQVILEYLEASLDEPESWYKDHEAKEGLMVLFTKHETLERNRQSPKILKAYQQLYQSENIYRTVDKVSFNPPENDIYNFMGSGLHWDVSLSLPIPFRLQGLLYLTDVKENSGAFHCVAGFHHKIDSWLQEIPKNVNPREFALETLEAQPVIGNAGDFIIWHQALPHCATPNKSNFPRIVQYLTYLPSIETNEDDVWI